MPDEEPNLVDEFLKHDRVIIEASLELANGSFFSTNWLPRHWRLHLRRPRRAAALPCRERAEHGKPPGSGVHASSGNVVRSIRG